MTDFLYPFLLIFLIVYAILEKTGILGGDDKRTVNAWVSVVIAAIFVGAVFPKIIVENLVLFMTVGLVVIFVGMMLWGFVSGGNVEVGRKWSKFYAIILGIAIVIAVLWASGAGGAVFGVLTSIFSFLFESSWSGTVWTNILFVAIIGGAIAIVLKTGAAPAAKKD